MENDVLIALASVPLAVMRWCMVIFISLIFHFTFNSILQHKPIGLLMSMPKGYRGRVLSRLPRRTVVIVFSPSLFILCKFDDLKKADKV
jgi:hypothetical protein